MGTVERLFTPLCPEPNKVQVIFIALMHTLHQKLHAHLSFLHNTLHCLQQKTATIVHQIANI